MKELYGKVAVITGAASGFGREFAIRCADEGMKVILTDIDTGGLGTTVALLKPPVSISVRITFIPSSAQRIANSRPNPLAAPVITAIFP